MQKIKNIEFLRLFLIFGVIAIHTFCSSAWSFYKIFPNSKILQLLNICFEHGNLCVEGFFIIAGFLLVVTFKDISFKKFILKKYIRLTPTIAFATIICALASLFGVIHFKIIPNLMSVLLLNHFGICFCIGSNPPLWYTSALFAGLVLYFWFLKNFKGKVLYIICCILAITAYALLEIFQQGNFGNPYHNYLGIFNVGFMRSIGGIGIGTILGLLYKNNINFKINKIVLSLLEVFTFSAIVWWIVLPHERINSIIFVILFTVLLYCFIHKTGFLSVFLENDIWAKLGKFQYSIYVTHYVTGKIFILGYLKHHPNLVYEHTVLIILFTFLLIIFAGILTYYMVEFPCTKILKEKLKI